MSDVILKGTQPQRGIHYKQAEVEVMRKTVARLMLLESGKFNVKILSIMQLRQCRKVVKTQSNDNVYYKNI